MRVPILVALAALTLAACGQAAASSPAPASEDPGVTIRNDLAVEVQLFYEEDGDIVWDYATQSGGGEFALPGEDGYVAVPWRELDGCAPGDLTVIDRASHEVVAIVNGPCVNQVASLSEWPPEGRPDPDAAPWQASPLPLDPGLLAKADRECRSSFEASDGRPGRLLVADARGADLMVLVYAMNSALGECDVRFNGRQEALAAVIATVYEVPVADGPIDVAVERVGGSPGLEPGSFDTAAGPIGEDIAEVRLLLTDGSSVDATVNDGWFAAWWPGDADATGVEGRDTAGEVVVRKSLE